MWGEGDPPTPGQGTLHPTVLIQAPPSLTCAVVLSWTPGLPPPIYSQQPEGACKRQKSNHVTCSEASHGFRLTLVKARPVKPGLPLRCAPRLALSLTLLQPLWPPFAPHTPHSCPRPPAFAPASPRSIFSQIFAQLVLLRVPGLGSNVTSEGPALSLASGGPRGPVSLLCLIFLTALLTIWNYTC